jgi:hypothetical protein
METRDTRGSRIYGGLRGRERVEGETRQTLTLLNLAHASDRDPPTALHAPPYEWIMSTAVNGTDTRSEQCSRGIEVQVGVVKGVNNVEWRMRRRGPWRGRGTRIHGTKKEPWLCRSRYQRTAFLLVVSTSIVHVYSQPDHRIPGSTLWLCVLKYEHTGLPLLLYLGLSTRRGALHQYLALCILSPAQCIGTHIILNTSVPFTLCTNLSRFWYPGGPGPDLSMSFVQANTNTHRRARGRFLLHAYLLSDLTRRYIGAHRISEH